MRTRRAAGGQQSAHTAPGSGPEVAQPKTPAIVKRSSTPFLNKRRTHTGITQAMEEKRAVDEGQWTTTPSTTTSLGTEHVFVIKGLLPGAESMMAKERHTWPHTDLISHSNQLY